MLCVFFFYAFINFLIFCVFLPATPLSGRSPDGKFQAKNRSGTLEVTEEEYHSYRNWELRGFSGHWMAFYLAPSLMLGGYLLRDKKARPDDGTPSGGNEPDAH